MQNSADGAWYFSRDGQQSGPLTYADLKEKADEGVLKPRTDLVWKEGMADWVPIGEIPGLFERLEVPPPTRASDSAAVQAVLEEDHRDTRLGHFGGCRRRSYLFVLVILPALLLFLSSVVTSYFPTLATSEVTAVAEKFGPIVVALLALYVGIQRFANLGMSRWWYLANFVPILNFWTTYRCVACPEGYALHKKMDAAGILLAILYWLALVGVVVASVITVAIIMGAAGSPEFQKQLKDLLEGWKIPTNPVAP